MGTLAALICALFSSSKDLVSKRLAFDVDGTVSAFGSFFFALPYYVVILLVLQIYGGDALDLTATGLTLIVLRSLTDTVAELTKMYALMYADISLVICVFALHPVLLLVASPIVTGDPLSASVVVAIFLIAIGSLILGYRKGNLGLWAQRKGAAIALLSTFCFALNTCLDRLAVQTTGPVMSGFLMTLLSALFLLPFLLRSGRRGLLRTHQRPFLLRGFFEVGFMVSKLTALQYLSAPVVGGILKSSLLLTIIGGRVVFKEGDFQRRMIAGSFVLAGVLVILLF